MTGFLTGIDTGVATGKYPGLCAGIVHQRASIQRRNARAAPSLALRLAAATLMSAIAALQRHGTGPRRMPAEARKWPSEGHGLSAGGKGATTDV